MRKEQKKLTILEFVKTIKSEYDSHKGSHFSAALAYYSIFSVAPLILIIISCIGIFIDKTTIEDEILNQFRGLLGTQGAEFIKTILQSVASDTANIISTIIGLVTLFLGATGFYINLQDALNYLWDVDYKAPEGIIATVKDRFLSFALILSAGFLFLVSLVLTSVLEVINNYSATVFSLPTWVYESLHLLLSFLIVSLLFGLIFKYLPHIDISFKDVTIGALFTSFLFIVGKFLLGLYIGNSSYTSAYGAAGSFIVFLVWMFYSSQLLLIGATFTKVYTHNFGSKSEEYDPEEPTHLIKALETILKYLKK